jgi:hypothetical protein
MKWRDWRARRACRTVLLQPAACALPVHNLDAVPLIQSNEKINEIPALFQRFAARVPRADSAVLRRVRAFAWHWCNQYLRDQKFSSDKTFHIADWLATSNYSGAEKTSLLNLAEHHHIVDGVLPRSLSARQMRVNIFKKKQWWDKYKHVRWIMPRSDLYKIHFGPLVHALESVVYDVDMGLGHPVFIKHVPVSDRPFFIEKLKRAGAQYLASDHSRFEAHFSAQVQNAFEFVVYEYLTQNNAYAREMVRRLKIVQTSQQKLLGPGFALTLGARRMSGDMTTSLGNGISNLLLMLFVANEFGLDWDGYVEGDDGICTMRRRDTGQSFYPESSYFERFGFELKMEVFEHLNEASFCGKIYDPATFHNVSNPILRILQTGWTHRTEYFDAGDHKLYQLQRAVALSLAVEYGSCPVIGSYARMLLRFTAPYEPIFGDAKHAYDWWELSILGGADWRKTTQDLVLRQPSVGDRLLVEKMYRISCADQQQLELFFDRNQALGWRNSLFTSLTPTVFRDAKTNQLCSRHPDFSYLPLT